MGEEQFQGIIDEAREYITKLEEAIDEESKELDTARGDSAWFDGINITIGWDCHRL